MKYSKEEKAMWLEDWKRSGKKAWAYAKANSLIPQTFCKWAKEETEQHKCFVEVSAQVTQPALHVPEILIEKGNVKIHIPLGPGGLEPRSVTEWLAAAL